jgi:nitrogenase subunit NifH
MPRMSTSSPPRKNVPLCRNNIHTCCEELSVAGLCQGPGIIFNSRGLKGEEDKIRAFAEEIGVPVDWPAAQVPGDHGL